MHLTAVERDMGKREGGRWARGVQRARFLLSRDLWDLLCRILTKIEPLVYPLQKGGNEFT